jgi:hypothetical protein
VRNAGLACLVDLEVVPVETKAGERLRNLEVGEIAVAAGSAGPPAPEPPPRFSPQAV